MLAEEQVLAFEFDGIRYDCGSKLGYLKAALAYTLKHAELKEEFSEYLEAFVDDRAHSARRGSATYFSHFLWRWLGRFSSRRLLRKRVEQRFHCEIAPLAPLRTRDVSQSRCDQHQS